MSDTKRKTYEELKSIMDRRKSYMLTDTSDVNADYIKSFMADSQKYLNDAQGIYDAINWGNASATYDERNAAWQALSERANKVGAYYYKNRNRYSNYDDIASMLDELSSGGGGVLDRFKGAKDFYGQWASQEDYDQSQKEYDIWKAEQAEFENIRNSEDFENMRKEGQKSIQMDKTTAQYTPKGKSWLKKLSNLSEGDRQLYEYFLATDYNRASEFLDKYSDIGVRKRAEQVSKYLNNLVLPEWGNALVSGVESFFGGAQNAVDALESLVGLDIIDAPQTTVSQYAFGMMSEDNEGLFKISTDLAQTIGNQLPSMAANALIPGAGLVTMGVSAAGNAYREMKNLGYGELQSFAYGALIGGTEAALQKVVGGITGLGSDGGIASKTIEKILPKITNGLARVAVKLGASAVDEGLEEAAQSILEPILKHAASLGNEAININWDEVVYSGLLGALSAGVLEGVPTVADSVTISQNAKKQYGGATSDIVSDILSNDPNNAFAWAMQKRLDAGKKISGLNIAELVKQGDATAISSAITQKLNERGETSDVTKLSELLTKEAMGEELTRAEKKLIKSSDFGRSIQGELNPESLSSDAEMDRWAEKIGTRETNAKEYNKQVQVKSINEDGTVELENGKSIKAEDVTLPNESDDLIFKIATQRVSRVDGWTNETANAMVKGYDGKVTATAYRKAYISAFEMGKNGEQASQIVELANQTGIKGSTLLAAYDMGMQATEKALTNSTEGGKIESEVKTDESTGIRLRDSSKRNGSKDSQKQVSGVEESTGRDTSGEDTERKVADSEAVKLADEGRKVKVSELGILNGSKTQTVTVVDKSQETSEMKKARKEAEKRGLKVRFFFGDNLVIEENGELISVRGYIKGEYVFVRADHPLYTSYQLMRHEIGHDMIAKGEVDINKVRAKLEETVGKENIDTVADMYALAYENSGLDADAIWEECICDSLGDMNVFSDYADIDQGIITMVLGDIKQATEDTKTAPNKTRGGPDGKASGEIFTLSNDYLKQVHKDDRHYFNRTLANKTKDIKAGQHKRIEINGAKRVYFFVADGYMSGEIVKSISNKRPNLYMKAREEFYATIEQSGEGADIWSEFDYLVERGSAEDAGYFGYGGATDRNDTFSQEPPTSYGERSKRPNVEYNDNPQESKELIEKLREKYGIREGKTSRELNAEDEYSQIFAKREEVGKLNQAIQEFEMSDDFKLQMDKLNQAIVEDNADKGIAEYLKWKKDSGYGQMMERRDALMKEIGNLQEAFAKEQKNNALAQEKTAIEKSGLSEADYFRKQAVKEFGYTPYFYDAGYIIPNGKMLNFSGEKGQHYGMRGQDHRAIDVIYADTQGTAALTRFMNDGNIRIMAETPGVDISSKIAPTKEQYSTIRSFIYDSANREYFSIDFSDENGRVVDSLQYENRINPTRIINDIKHYYETGEIREQSNVDKYRFSRELDTAYLSAVNRGDMETAQRMVDEAAKKAGYTIKAYHGTNAQFDIFDNNKAKSNTGSSFYGNGFYFSTSRMDVANYGEIIKPVYLRAEKILDLDSDTWTYDLGIESKKEVVEVEKTKIEQVPFPKGFINIHYTTKDAPNEWKSISNVSPMQLTDDETGKTFVEHKLNPKTSILPRDVKNLAELAKSKGYDTIRGGGTNIGDLGTEYVVFLSNQIKSADPVTYDDEGNVIPLSQRFNEGNEDIRYSRDLDIEGDSAYELAKPPTNRELLANALLDTVQNEVEYKKLDDYKAVIKYLEAEETKLESLKEQIRSLDYNKDKAKFKELREEIRKTEAGIDIHDKKLLQLESTQALKNVLTRAKREAYSKALAKGRETLHANVEGRHKTIERNRIKDIAHDLDKLLNKGTKKRNVKIGAQGVVRAALDLSNMYFATDDELIMSGIVTETTTVEEDALGKYRELYNELHSTDDDVTNHKEERKEIRSKMHEVKQDLIELLERERKRINKVKAKDIFSTLIDEYKKLSQSPETYIAKAFDADTLQHIEKLQNDVGDKLANEMTLEDLKNLYKAFKMIKTMVSNANKLFKEEGSATIEQLGAESLNEIRNQGHKKKFTKMGKAVSSLSWNNLKPVYLIERTGSKTLQKLFQKVLDAESVWAKTMADAKAYIEEQVAKYNYKKWDFKTKYEFATPSGMKFKLNLGQMMTIYAYSKRGDQAIEHLRTDGFVFDKVTEKKLGGIIEYEYNDKTAYKITDGVRLQIINKLTKEQRDYVDSMQKYLSNDMGAKGNEVSIAMYGIELFGEENYLPIHSEGAYLERVREQARGDIKIKNKGFTKSTTKHARNAIVLSEFDKLCTEHIAEMSSYYAFTLPLEDFYRVYNYEVASDDKMDKMGVIPALINAYGEGSTQAIDQLLSDLNGGARTDQRETLSKVMMSLYKKAKVLLSLSVIVQQPSAILRAKAMINPKYFIRKRTGKHKQLWNEMKKYAPVTIIKEMGYFDVGMGKSSADWLLSKNTFMDWVDEIASKPASLADEVTWVAIWNATKREIASKNPTLNTSSEEFLKKAGERFEDIIRHTQVYDSTLARSGNMRSKSALMQMEMAFMAEPTTSLNMREMALRSKDKKRIGRTTAAIYASSMFNSILVAFIYAMRDDDEDETFWEKYISALTSSFIDNINPISALPIAKNLWSLAQGYGVERSDMSIADELLDATKKLATMDYESAEGEDIAKAVLDLVGDLSALTGLPVATVVRDVFGIINFVKTITKGDSTTLKSIEDALQETLRKEIPVVGWFKGESKSEKLYGALLAKDDKYVSRFKSTYEDEKSYESAVRKSLRDNDPRVKQAALARLNRDNNTYYNLMMDIIDEGIFSRAMVKEAFEAEYNYQKRLKEEAEK